MFSVDAIFVPQNRMRIYQEQLEVRSDGRGTYEITDDIQAKIDQSGLSNGIVTVLFSTPVAASSSWRTPIRLRDGTWRNSSIGLRRKTPITSRTAPKAAMTCRRTFA